MKCKGESSRRGQYDEKPIVSDSTFTCPRCFHEFATRPDAQFCPHCGLKDAARAATDTAPIDVAVHDRTYRVMDRLEIGSICMLYRCRFKDGSDDVEGVFKIAHDPRTNDLVSNEAAVLRQLHLAKSAGEFAAFLPKVVESFALGDGSSTPRWANVMRMHKGIHSPDELYTLADVRTQYPAGLGPRDVAWMWRRLLSVLGFIHSQDVVHSAVLPTHVLIEPREHKLLLVDFCAARTDALKSRRPPTLINGGYDEWYLQTWRGIFRRAPDWIYRFALAA